MRTSLALALAAILFATPALAETIKVTADGLVCAFCAKGIEKSFKKNPAVKTVHMDLNTKIVTIVTKPSQTLDDDSITQTITDAGFTVVDIKHAE